MELYVVIFWIFVQLCFAGFQFFFIFFGIASYANEGDLSPEQSKKMTKMLFICPLVSVGVCFLVGILYAKDTPLATNWWHLIPLIVFAVCYFHILKSPQTETKHHDH